MIEEKSSLPSIPAEVVIEQLEGKCSAYEATIDSLRERIKDGDKHLAEQKNINAAHLEVIHNWERKCTEYKTTIEELRSEKAQLEELAEGQASDIESLRERVTDRTKDVQRYDEENKQLREMLNISDKAREVAEKELRKEVRTLDMEVEAKAEVQRKYEEIQRKNQKICAAIADMVRAILEN